MVGAPFSPGHKNSCGTSRRFGKVTVILAAYRVRRALEVVRLACPEGKQVHDLQATVSPLTAKADAAPQCRVSGLAVGSARIEQDPEQAWTGRSPRAPQQIPIPPDDDGTVVLPIGGFQFPSLRVIHVPDSVPGRAAARVSSNGCAHRREPLRVPMEQYHNLYHPVAHARPPLAVRRQYSGNASGRKGAA